MIETLAAVLGDVRLSFRSLRRSKVLTLAVVTTLALGIGANAAMFTLVRGVLLRPLVNREENRLIYLRQTAPGLSPGPVPFSVPEIQDLRASVKTVGALGEFSTVGFTMLGLGDPRVVRAGVVDGNYFEVMGLRPVLGRLLDKRDDGPNAAGAAVLTHRFWSQQLNADPAVLGKSIRLGTRAAEIVGVLEPSIPYPAETEMIANVVTSPHHLSATMVTGRVHRMTELFGRLAPGADLAKAVSELKVVYGSMVKQHPESYSAKANFQIDAVMLRDQLTSGARTMLLVLMAAAVLIFVIACSNAANLILARVARREGELAIRAALGAGTGALRRTLLAESLVLCVAGAALGLLIAQPMVDMLARYASRLSVRALDLTLDPGALWLGALLALSAAVVLAFVPRLPSAGASGQQDLAAGNRRVTGTTRRRLAAFAVLQTAASFVLLTGAAVAVNTLLSLQTARTGIDAQRVLTMDVPVMAYGKSTDQIRLFYEEILRRVRSFGEVESASLGTFVPWRDGGSFGPGFEFSADGHVSAAGEENPRARFRTVTPGYFASIGLPLVAGRDFNEADRAGGERVVIVSQSLAQRMFPTQDALNRHMRWTDPVIKFIDVSGEPRRIIGVAADLEDENLIPGPALAVYHPLPQEQLWAANLFIRARGNPYSLRSPVSQLIRGMSAGQPIERVATLEDARAEVLTPDRLNTVVSAGFAAVALAIAVVGVAGVLAFLVSGRKREFGIRLAIGSQPRHLVANVVGQGLRIAAAGVVAGAVAGYALARLAGSFFAGLKMPGALPVAGSACILVIAALLASLVPALLAARVNVVDALRSE
jgi:putative ABC transport system permease protein